MEYKKTKRTPASDKKTTLKKNVVNKSTKSVGNNTPETNKNDNKKRVCVLV